MQNQLGILVLSSKLRHLGCYPQFAKLIKLVLRAKLRRMGRINPQIGNNGVNKISISLRNIRTKSEALPYGGLAPNSLSNNLANS